MSPRRPTRLGCSRNFASAPIEVAGRKRAAALVGRVPTWSPELAITGKPGGKGALEEALAQSAREQD